MDSVRNASLSPVGMALSVVFCVFTFSAVFGGPLWFDSTCEVAQVGETGWTALGDFNEDGRLDFVMANSYANNGTGKSLYIYAGTEEGCFGEILAAYEGMPDPGSVAVADLDNDDHLDIAVTNSPSGSGDGVTILMGNGDGSFGPPQFIQVGDGPGCVRAAHFNDLDDDYSYIDLVCVNVWASTLTVLLNDGNGNFTVTTFPCSGLVQYLETADFNNDGHTDVIVTSPHEGDNVFHIFLGDGHGAFLEHTVMSVETPVHNVVCGDFNEDGCPDFALHKGSALLVFYGNCSGHFSDAPDETFPTGAPGLAAQGDLNGDSHVDIVIAQDGSTNVFILLGDGEGGFGPPLQGTMGYPTTYRRPAIVDVNQDGSNDLVLSSADRPTGDSHVSVSFNVLECLRGTVDAGTGNPTDVLFLNGSAGDDSWEVVVNEGELIWSALLLPPAGGTGKFVVHADLGRPTVGTTTVLPLSIGLSCFPFFLNLGANPLAVWNNLGRTQKLGESHYFDGSSIPNPDRAPAVFLQLFGGDPVYLPSGTVVTFQGLLLDPASASPRMVSTTNAVVMRVE